MLKQTLKVLLSWMMLTSFVPAVSGCFWNQQASSNSFYKVKDISYVRKAKITNLTCVKNKYRQQFYLSNEEQHLFYVNTHTEETTQIYQNQLQNVIKINNILSDNTFDSKTETITGDGNLWIFGQTKTSWFIGIVPGSQENMTGTSQGPLLKTQMERVPNDEGWYNDPEVSNLTITNFTHDNNGHIFVLISFTKNKTFYHFIDALKLDTTKEMIASVSQIIIPLKVNDYTVSTSVKTTDFTHKQFSTKNKFNMQYKSSYLWVSWIENDQTASSNNEEKNWFCVNWLKNNAHPDPNNWTLLNHTFQTMTRMFYLPTLMIPHPTGEKGAVYLGMGSNNTLMWSFLENHAHPHTLNLRKVSDSNLNTRIKMITHNNLKNDDQMVIITASHGAYNTDKNTDPIKKDPSNYTAILNWPNFKQTIYAKKTLNNNIFLATKNSIKVIISGIENVAITVTQNIKNVTLIKELNNSQIVAVDQKNQVYHITSI